MVEHQAADLRTFDGGAGGVRAEQNFFVGADDARGAIEHVNDHAAASDDVEFFFSHCSQPIFFALARSPESYSLTHPRSSISAARSRTLANRVENSRRSVSLSGGVPAPTASLSMTPSSFSEALSVAIIGRHALAPRLKVHAMRNSSSASEYKRISSTSPERQTCHPRCHSRGIALAGPATTP